jgi:hypothetical protein
MKISKIAALIGCGIIALEAYLSLTQWVSDDPQFLADYFWSSVVPQNFVASLILLLPAIALLFAGPFRGFTEKTSFMYPVLLLGQFWLVAATLDGLATPLIFLILIAPVATIYALLIFIDGRVNWVANTARP